MERLTELINSKSKLSVNDFASILRDRKGLQSKDIGMGNEKALNQLICHHSVIFKPSESKLWISTDPFQLGAYECYDFSSFFKNNSAPNYLQSLTDSSNYIPCDSFLSSKNWTNFLQFKKANTHISNTIKSKKNNLSSAFIDSYIKFNPEYYYTYEILGDYYSHAGKHTLAIDYYKAALSKEVNSLEEINKIKRKMNTQND